MCILKAQLQCQKPLVNTCSDIISLNPQKNAQELLVFHRSRTSGKQRSVLGSHVCKFLKSFLLQCLNLKNVNGFVVLLTIVV